jgi:hypothetical protein
MGNITYRASCGEIISDAAKNAAKIAALTSTKCRLIFNDVEIDVSPTSNADDIIRIYDLIMRNNDLRAILLKNGL